MLDTAVFGDPKEILLSLSGQHHLPELLPLAVQLLTRNEQIALTRIWLTRPPAEGDCEVCAMSPECPARERCLHLAASYGHSMVVPGDHWERVDGDFRRMPLGVRKVGQIAATGEILRVNIEPIGDQNSPDSSWIVRPDWAENEGIQMFLGLPLRYRNINLGVLGIFARTSIGPSCDQWLRMIADHLAAAIANARAIEEIESLKQQLELENEYLREEVLQTSYGDLVGNSPALQTVSQQIDLVAPTDSSVLILGESGTGKELVARELHRRSLRARRRCRTVGNEAHHARFSDPIVERRLNTIRAVRPSLAHDIPCLHPRISWKREISWWSASLLIVRKSLFNSGLYEFGRVGTANDLVLGQSRKWEFTCSDCFQTL